jgi:hypothetical protein
MIDQWRAERAQLVKEQNAIRDHIARHPNPDRFSSGRAKLRALLSHLETQRWAVHLKIRQYEQDQEMHDIFKGISGLSDAEVQKLMRDMEKLKLVNT